MVFRQKACCDSFLLSFDPGQTFPRTPLSSSAFRLLATKPQTPTHSVNYQRQCRFILTSDRVGEIIVTIHSVPPPPYVAPPTHLPNTTLSPSHLAAAVATAVAVLNSPVLAAQPITSWEEMQNAVSQGSESIVVGSDMQSTTEISTQQALKMALLKQSVVFNGVLSDSWSGMLFPL